MEIYIIQFWDVFLNLRLAFSHVYFWTVVTQTLDLMDSCSNFLYFFLLFHIFWFIIFYVTMFDLSNPIERYKYLLLYFNFLFIFSWIHEYKILTCPSEIFFFIWRIIALQNFVVSCQVSAWMDHRYTYVPSLLTSLPFPSSSHPSRLLLSEVSNCDISFLIFLLFSALVWFVFLLMCMSSAFFSFKFIFFCELFLVYVFR